MTGGVFEVLTIVILAIGLAAVHLVADRFPVFGIISRPRWLSAASGVSTVYVFVYLFPKLDVLDGIEPNVYAVVFLGLAAFFALERLGRVAQSPRVERLLDEPVFWFHITAFATYNLLIGYLLARGVLIDGRIPFAVAMAMHGFGNDEGLRRHHREPYHRIGRWVLAGSVVLGALAGFVVAIDPWTLGILLGLLAGGIIFNTIKEELPPDRESSFVGFAAGAGVFVVAMYLLG